MNRDYTFWSILILISFMVTGVRLIEMSDKLDRIIDKIDTPVVEQTETPPPISKETEALVSAIKSRYKQTDVEELLEIVEAAIRYEATDSAFPTRYDILAVVAIESGFNCKAVNKDDHGCMQINKKYWPHLPREAFHTIDGNIKYGAHILETHYVKYEKGKTHALKVYNSGATAVEKGREKPKYVEKFQKEYLAMF